MSTPVTIGVVYAPRLPENYVTRIAEELYDSMQDDPLFTINPYGPTFNPPGVPPPVLPPVTVTADTLPDYALYDQYNIMDYGAVADGVTDCSLAFASALADIAANGSGALYVPMGTYMISTSRSASTWINRSRISMLTIPNVPCVIFGDGQRESTIYTAQDCTMFEGFFSRQADFTLVDLRIQYLGGFTTNSNAFAIVHNSQNLRCSGVEFRNWKQGIATVGVTDFLLVDRCAFKYDHGRAGVTQLDPTFADPVVGINGGGKTTHIYRTYFNGLIDPTFRANYDPTKAPMNPGIDPTQYTPADGLLITGSQVQNLVISDVTVINQNQSAILVTGGYGNLGTTDVLIEHNLISGPTPDNFVFTGAIPPAGTTQSHTLPFYSEIYGVRLVNCSGEVSNNSIQNCSTGILLQINALTGNPGLVSMNGNLVDGCIVGMRATGYMTLRISENTIDFNRQFMIWERNVVAGGIGIELAGSQKAIRLVDCPGAKIFSNRMSTHSDWWNSTGKLTASFASFNNDASGSTLFITPTGLAVGSPIDVYIKGGTLGPWVASGVIAADGNVTMSTSFANYDPDHFLIGQTFYWSVSMTSHDAVVISGQCGITTLNNNVMSGGLWPIVHTLVVADTSVTSTNDTFQNYGYVSLNYDPDVFYISPILIS